MMLAGKYEAFEAVPGAPSTVQRARHTVSGKSVLVHQLVPGSPNAVETLKLALRYALRRPGSSTLLDVFDGPACTYVVTANRPECLALNDWLRRKLSGHRTKRSRHSSNSGTTEGPEREPFSSPDQSVAPANHSLEVHHPDPAATLNHQNTATPGQTGEFTRMFLDQKTAAAPPPPSLFDGQVQRPAHAPPNPQARTPVPVDSGEFTRLFRPGASAQARPPVELPHLPGRDSGSVFPVHGPGEFTRLFGDEKAEPGAPDITDQRGPGEFTRLFAGTSERDAPNFTGEVGGAERGNLLPDVLSPAASSSAPQVSSGPSEFTRVIRSGADREPAMQEPAGDEGGPGATAAPSIQLPKIPDIKAPEVKLPQVKVPAAPASPAAPQLSTGLTPVLLIVGSVLIIALALILIFALRR